MRLIGQLHLKLDKDYACDVTDCPMGDGFLRSYCHVLYPMIFNAIASPVQIRNAVSFEICGATVSELSCASYATFLQGEYT